MLIAFLIRDEHEWHDWRNSISSIGGKAVLHISDCEPVADGYGTDMRSAIDEVEAFDEE